MTEIDLGLGLQLGKKKKTNIPTNHEVGHWEAEQEVVTDRLQLPVHPYGQHNEEVANDGEQHQHSYDYWNDDDLSEWGSFRDVTMAL